MKTDNKKNNVNIDTSLIPIIGKSNQNHRRQNDKTKKKNKVKSNKRKKSRRKNRYKLVKNKDIAPTTIRDIIEQVAQDALVNGGSWTTDNLGNGEPIVSLSVGEDSSGENRNEIIEDNSKHKEDKNRIPFGRRKGAYNSN